MATLSLPPPFGSTAGTQIRQPNTFDKVMAARKEKRAEAADLRQQQQFDMQMNEVQRQQKLERAKMHGDVINAMVKDLYTSIPAEVGKETPDILQQRQMRAEKVWGSAIDAFWQGEPYEASDFSNSGLNDIAGAMRQLGVKGAETQVVGGKLMQRDPLSGKWGVVPGTEKPPAEKGMQSQVYVNDEGDRRMGFFDPNDTVHPHKFEDGTDVPPGWTTTSTQITGTPSEFSKTENARIRDMAAMEEDVVARISDAIKDADEGDSNTFSAAFMRLVNEGRAEIGTLVAQGVLPPDIADETVYKDTWEHLGVRSAETRSQLIGLAYKVASVDAGQHGREVSNEDMRNALRRIGADLGNDQARKAVLIRVGNEIIRSSRFYHKFHPTEGIDPGTMFQGWGYGGGNEPGTPGAPKKRSWNDLP